MPAGFYPRPSAASRFWPRTRMVSATTAPSLTCWIWTGTKSGAGYGLFNADGRRMGAHVWAYEDAYGPVPEGLELDHLCRTPLCVRPSHLEAVTHAENLRRSPITTFNLNAKKTHCKNGHPFDEVNTIHTYRGGRACRVCHSVATNKWNAKRYKMPSGETQALIVKAIE